MHITPLDSTPKTNFNGKLIDSPTLKRVFKQSEEASIQRFKKLMKHSEQVNDNLIFKLDEKNKVKMISDNIIKIKEYILKIFNEKTANEDTFTIVDSCDLYASQERIDEDNKKILGILTDFIKETYYSPKKEISQRVCDGIIKTIEENKG